MNIDFKLKEFKPYRFLKPIRFGTLVFLFYTLTLTAQPIECDNSFYLITQDIQAQTSSFHKVTQDNNGLFSTQLIKADMGRLLNASGYRTRDKFIYAIDQNTHEVVQIDAAGNMTSWGVPQYLDTVNYTFHAADMGMDGSNFAVVGRNKATGFDDRLFQIVMNPNNFVAGIVNLSASYGAVQLDDIAYSPIYGIVYGYDNISKQLVSISDFSGQINIIAQAPANATAIGGLFFDKLGDLYGFGRQGVVEDKTFYKIDNLDGTVTQLNNDVNSIFSDGCSCPYSVTLQKQVNTSETVPCSEVIFTYTVINQAGLHQSPTLRDSFPPEYTILGFFDNSFPSVANINGIGTNQLEMTNLPFPLGESKISFRVEVGETASGLYEEYAKLSGLSLGLGSTIVSDNPITTAIDDKTKLNVVGLDNILDNQIPYICEGDTALLTTNILGVDYEWSTGSTTNATEIIVSGWYYLTVTTDCQTVVDSIYIPESPQPLVLDLGQDKTIELGESIQLNYTSNAIGSVQLTWSSSNPNSLSCTTCPTPIIQSTESAWFYLDLIDEAFCSATDSIFIDIRPNRQVFIPSAFTPDFDGVNDYFYVQGKWDAMVKKMLVADRWGNILFKKNNAPINEEWNGWDGTYRGKGVESGVYIWYVEIEFLDGVVESYSGDVSVVR